MSITDRLIKFADEIPSALEAQLQLMNAHLDNLHELPAGPEKTKAFESYKLVIQKQDKIIDMIRAISKDDDQKKVDILSGTKY